MAQVIASATPADMVKDVREELGEALVKIDVARTAVAAGEQIDLGGVISSLERAESKMDDLEEIVGEGASS